MLTDLSSSYMCGDEFTSSPFVQQTTVHTREGEACWYTKHSQLQASAGNPLGQPHSWTGMIQSPQDEQEAYPTGYHSMPSHANPVHCDLKYNMIRCFLTNISLRCSLSIYDVPAFLWCNLHVLSHLISTIRGTNYNYPYFIDKDTEN